MDESENSKKIEFKFKKKNKSFRQKSTLPDSDEDEVDDKMSSLLEDAKELRKLRKKPSGVSAIGLALGKKLKNEAEIVAHDPFKLKTGGFIDMKALKSKSTVTEELDAVNLGSVFSAETNRRDEDADMMKYIEEELGKIKGNCDGVQENENSGDSDGPIKLEDVLFEVPEHLRRSAMKKSEEMLSNQMLSGIPEVDLGIEERIRNIEATEEAKLQVLRDKMKKKDKSMSFVPTNMAVNFVQQNRFNVDESEPRLKKPRKEIPIERPAAPKPPVPSGAGKSKSGAEEKATDDFHFEKFKKQFRRF